MLSWIILLVSIIAMFFLHKHYPKIFAALFSFSIAVAVIMIIFGIFVIKDALEFKENFAVNQNVFVLSEQNKYVSAVVLNFQAENADEAILPYENISLLESNVEQGLAPDGFYKVLILEKETLEDVEIENIDIGLIFLDKDEAIQILYSNDPTNTLRKTVSKQGITLTNSEIKEMYGTDNGLKQAIFTSLLIDVFSSDPLIIITGVKNGNIIILPETLMFKTIKYIPLAIFQKARNFVKKEVEDELDGQG